MNSLLQPVFSASHTGVYARQPLQPFVGRWPDVPVLILFGDNDWLKPFGDAADLFMAAVDASRSREQPQQSALIITPHAGHHLYMDNAAHFNAAVNRLHHE